MACILKPPPEQSLTRLQRHYNALMERFLIVIEQLFAEATLLRHGSNLQLGLMQVQLPCVLDPAPPLAPLPPCRWASSFP